MFKTMVKVTVNTAIEIGGGAIGGIATRKLLDIVPGGKFTKACVVITGLVATMAVTDMLEKDFNKRVDNVAEVMKGFQKM